MHSEFSGQKSFITLLPLMNDDIEQISYHLQQLQAEFEDLAVGGLRTLGTEHLPLLENLSEHFANIGAGHSSQCLQDLINAIRNNNKSAAAALMRAQTSMRLFERILTKQAIIEDMQLLFAQESDQ